MFQLQSLLQRLGKRKNLTLAEAVERHISGSGTGFELDDGVSEGRFPKPVVDKLCEISRQYRNAEYPVGVSNPESFDDLKRLAAEYSEPAFKDAK